MFRAPEFLWWGILPILIATSAWLQRVRARPEAQVESTLGDRPGNWRGRAGRGKVAFFPTLQGSIEVPKLPWRLSAGLLLVVIALARPQWGPETRPTIQAGSDILIAIDLSRSMSATDVAPSRLARAKQVAADLIEHLPGERVGLIVFSGVAILQAPLSLDHDALMEFLPALQIDTGPEGGTNFKNLFQTAAESFGPGSMSAKDLIILSDGEANDPHWSDQIGLLESGGIAVIGLGVGTPAGATLPDPAEGVFRDTSGAVVVSHLEDGNLAQLAARTHGVYVDASFNFDAARAARAIVAQDATGRKGGTGATTLKERFQLFLAVGGFLIAWSLWREFPIRLRRRDPSLPRRARSPVSQAVGLILVASLAGGTLARAQVDEDLSDTLGEQLHNVVAQLAVKRPLHAADYAVLAGMTIGYGRWRRAAHHPVNEGILYDGLTAVAAGRALDPKAADWATLQISLRALMRVPPPPPPPPPPPHQEQSLAHPPPPNPEELALLQKLLQVRERDSAVRLYHLLHPPAPAGDTGAGKNW